MRKGLISLFTAMAMTASAFTAFAADTAAPEDAVRLMTAAEEIELSTASTEYGDYLYYETNSDGTEITITECDTSASGALDIPAQINGLPVTAIGYEAFYGCSGLTSVTIPDGVTSIC